MALYEHEWPLDARIGEMLIRLGRRSLDTENIDGIMDRIVRRLDEKLATRPRLQLSLESSRLSVVEQANRRYS